MRKHPVFAAALLVALFAAPALAADGKVTFEPVRAPSKGPENAKVTVYEVADFM